MQHALHNLSLSLSLSINHKTMIKQIISQRELTSYLQPCIRNLSVVCVYIFFLYHLHHRSNHLHFSGATQ